MRKALRLLGLALLCGCATRGGAGSNEAAMSFFVTSVGSGNGANLGGLAGADEHCRRLAEAVGAGARTWRAYLSAAGGGAQPATNARDRIGRGPWYNARGLMVASTIADLHGATNMLSKNNSLNERGEVVNGRGDTPNRHDILTGSTPDGTLATGAGNLTCDDWTSAAAGSAQVGHHDRVGGGERPTSWNSAHASRGCGQQDLRGSGGDGLFYCFAF